MTTPKAQTGSAAEADPGPLSGPGAAHAGSKLQRAARWLADREIWLLAAAAPLLLIPSRWSPLAAAAIGLIWLIRWIHLGKMTVPTPADVPMVWMGFMTALGLWVAIDRAASLAAVWRWVLGVALFYALANGVRGAERRRWLAVISIVGSLALLCLALLGTNWAAVRLLRLQPLYGRLPSLLIDIEDSVAFHPRIMGMALGAWLPVPAALWLLGREGRLRRWAALCTFLLAAALLLTQSLQGLAGVALGLLLVAVMWRRRLLWLLPLGLALLLLAVLLCGPARLAGTLLSPGNPLGIAVTLRVDMWSRALAMLHDMPFTGIGLDQFPLLQFGFYPGVMLGPEPHAHNLFLQVGLDLGWPGLLAFLWLLGALGWAAWRAYERAPDDNWRALMVGAAGGTLSYLGAGLLDTMWTAKPSLVLWWLLGTLAALSTTATPSEAVPGGTRFATTWLRRVWPLALVVALLVPGLWIARTGLARNAALVQAHRLLWSADQGAPVDEPALSRLAAELQRLASSESDNPQLYHLLGRVRAELGQYDAALAAFQARVAVDGQAPLDRYAPWERWRRRVAGEARGDGWSDLLWVYSAWQSRFPLRAEYYVLHAVVRSGPQGDVSAAVQLLQAGLDRGAQPGGLLQHHLRTLQETAGPPPALMGS